MVLNELGKQIFEMKSPLIEHIIAFLDPKSIANLALVSKHFRNMVGSVIQEVIHKQFAYQHQTFDFNYNFYHIFNDYEIILNTLTKIFNEQVYRKLVIQINPENKIFFQDFFQCVFQQSIHLADNELYNQKRGLIQLASNVLQSLFKMQKNIYIPQLNSKADYKKLQKQIQTRLVDKKNKLLKFITNFLTHIQYMNQNNIDEKQYKQIIQIRSYRSKAKILFPIYGTYQGKVYHMKYGNSYYSYSNYNITTLIVQFLHNSDIIQMRALSKWFSHQIPTIISNLSQSLRNKIQDAQTFIDGQNFQMIQLINANIDLKLYDHFYGSSIKSYQFLESIDYIQLMTLVFQIIPQTDRINDIQDINQKMYEYHVNHKEIENSPYNDYFYWKFNESQMKLIEDYENENKFKFGKLSPALNRLQNNIKINYFLSKDNKTEQYYKRLLNEITCQKNNQKQLSVREILDNTFKMLEQKKHYN